MSSRAIRGTTGTQEQKVVNLRDCGPAGCDIDWLSSQRVEAEIDDVMAFTREAMEKGWGDGLPLIPPTEGRVREFLSKNNRYADEVICKLPPSDAECTVEKIAINAVMAGAPPWNGTCTTFAGGSFAASLKKYSAPICGPVPAPALP